VEREPGSPALLSRLNLQ